MDIQDRLEAKRKSVEEALDRILPRGESSLEKAMRYAVLSGGKRFRPLLALFSAESFGLAQERVLPFACALELIHNYSLIHDDLPVIDDDDYRRGQPSCHKAYGEAIALLAGDGLLTLAFEVMAGAPWDRDQAERKVRLITEMARSAGIGGMVHGQALDITLPADALSEDALLEMMEKKTGALILASVRVGPILAGASPSIFEAFSEFGRNIGVAFQIRDDLLDASEEAPPSGAVRPSAVGLWGREKARQRLEELIRRGVRALDSLSQPTQGLRFLAQRLLEIREDDGKTS
ncbi:MAG: polyprenyl synthetase family protein [Candidatus Aminicenantales bacterium]